ncbi:MAG: hypothetical protein ACOY0T_24070 [Myxococcota bacterium]
MQAGKANTDASAAPRVLVERPPEGLLRGRAEGSRWLLVAVALVALLVLVGFYARKLRRKNLG